MVKSFTPDTNNSLEATIQGARDNATAISQLCDTIAAKIQNQKELSRHKRRKEVRRKKKSLMRAALEAEASKRRELQKHGSLHEFSEILGFPKIWEPNSSFWEPNPKF